MRSQSPFVGVQILTRVLPVVLWAWLLAPAAAAQPRAGGGFADLPDAPARAAALLRSLPEDARLSFDPARIKPDAIVFTLRSRGSSPPAPVGQLMLFDLAVAPPAYARRTRSFAVGVENSTADPAVLARLVAAAHAVERNDDGTFGRGSQLAGSGVKARLPGTGAAAALIAALAVWLAVLLRARRADADSPVRLAIKPAHVVQAATQASILFYWGQYWRGVPQHVPALAAQLLFAVLLDGCLSLAVRRRWDMGLTVFPIVFSINLFIWFGNPLSALLCVAIAVSSKVFLRRGQTHVFNPSVFGLAVFGVAFLLHPGLGYDSLFNQLNAPPNMGELILLLSLVPISRFPVVLVSIGMFAALRGVTSSHGMTSPGITFPPMLLAMTLLATDPATIPKTGVGRLMFGLCAGLGIALISTAMSRAGLPDDFAKVFPIAIANLLTPWLDRLGSLEWMRKGGRLCDARWNLAHAALWLCLIVPQFARDKAGNFVSAHHWTFGTPRLARGEDDVPTCRENPVFCEPFSLAAEAELALGRRPR